MTLLKLLKDYLYFQRSIDNDIANSLNAFVALYKEAGTRMKRTDPKSIARIY